METKQIPDVAEVQAGRQRFVPRGVATTDLALVRAEGSTVWDADGREYLDFAGGIACQNLGHNPEAIVQAVHEQVDRYLHQCFMVGLYEPYVEVCRRLDELWPGPSETKSLLVNSGAEAIENAVKIARFATRRPGVIVFDRAFHGRTNLTMAMTSKLVYKQGFGPLAPEVYRAPAPYPYRGVTTDDALAGIELLFNQDVDPGAVLDELAGPSSRARAEEVGQLLRSGLEKLAQTHKTIGEVRGLGPMLALELQAKSADEAKRVTVSARERGLVLLSCGLYGNVIRLLPPLTATDEELGRGLSILDEAFATIDA